MQCDVCGDQLTEEEMKVTKDSEDTICEKCYELE